MRFNIYLISGLCALTTAVVAQSGPSLEQVRQAIDLGGQYAAYVLLDEKGASRCDYDMLDGTWHDYEPAWHTGQLIWGLLSAYEISGDTLLLASAQRAGHWWASLAIEDGPLEGFFLGEHGGDLPPGMINFTTLADGTPGLFELSRITQDPKYAEVATRAGNWAIRHLYLPEQGLFYDIIDARTGEIWTRRSPHYPGDDLPLRLTARPSNEGFLFKDMYRHTGNKNHRDVFMALCNSLIEKQDNLTGLWLDYHPNHRESGKLHPRFNTWYAESLLEGYALTGDDRYLQAALRTARQLLRWQQKNGHIYYTNRLDGSYDPSSVCGSATAFAAIIWLKLIQLGYSEFVPGVNRAASWIVANQFPENHPDPNLRGAFLETWSKWQDGQLRVYVRDIATSFSLRFLAAYHQYLIAEAGKE